MVIGPDKALNFAERIEKKWQSWSWRMKLAAGAILLLAIVVAISGAKIVVDKAWREKPSEPAPVASPVASGAIVPAPAVPVPPSSDVAITGPLRPGREPTPPNGCDDPDFANAFKIVFGKLAAACSGKGKYTALTVASCPVLTIDGTPVGINVEAELYDETGKWIASVHDNVVDAIAGGRVHVDRSGGLNSLLVRDDHLGELLYVRYVNQNAIVVRGQFGCKGHPLVSVTESGIRNGTTSIGGAGCFANLGGIHFD